MTNDYIGVLETYYIFIYIISKANHGFVFCLIIKCMTTKLIFYCLEKDTPSHFE